MDVVIHKGLKLLLILNCLTQLNSGTSLARCTYECRDKIVRAHCGSLNALNPSFNF